MNTVIRQLSIVLLAASATAAFASSDTAAGQRVEVIAPPTAAAAAQAVLALRDLDTTYGMSTGRQLVVTSVGDAVRVRYGRRVTATLRHDGQGSFVSHDGQLALQFELDRHGDPQQVTLSLPAAWL